LKLHIKHSHRRVLESSTQILLSKVQLREATSNRLREIKIELSMRIEAFDNATKPDESEKSNSEKQAVVKKHLRM